MEFVRTFIAVELDELWHEELARLQDRLRRALWQDRDLKWTRPEGIHLTLKFLGPVPEVDLPGVCAATDMAVRGHVPFEVEASVLGSFPPRRPARVLWLGSQAVPAALIKLQAGLEQCLAEVGFEPEKRAYSPHFTLARVHGARAGEAVSRYLAKAGPVEGFPPLLVAALTVFRSDLTRLGAEYTVLHRVRLEG